MHIIEILFSYSYLILKSKIILKKKVIFTLKFYIKFASNGSNFFQTRRKGMLRVTYNEFRGRRLQINVCMKPPPPPPLSPLNME